MYLAQRHVEQHAPRAARDAQQPEACQHDRRLYAYANMYTHAVRLYIGICMLREPVSTTTVGLFSASPGGGAIRSQWSSGSCRREASSRAARARA